LAFQRAKPAFRDILLNGLMLLIVAVIAATTTTSAVAVDDNINAGNGQQETVAEGFFKLPEFVTYEGQDYDLLGGALTRDQMQLLYPGVTWVNYREDGTTQWEYHTFDGYVFRWNQNSTVVVAGAWQIIEDRICWTYNGPFCRRIWNTERSDLFAVPIGPDKPLMPARFEIGDPLGLSNRKVVWLVTQSQDSEERRPINPIQPDIAPTEDPNKSDRAVDDRGAPQIFTLD
jgi:hypothetical protein